MPQHGRPCRSIATGSSRPRWSGSANICATHRRDASSLSRPTTRARLARRARSRKRAGARSARSSARTPSRMLAPSCARPPARLIGVGRFFSRTLRRRRHPAGARSAGPPLGPPGDLRQAPADHPRQRRPPVSERRAARRGAVRALLTVAMYAGVPPRFVRPRSIAAHPPTPVPSPR